MKVSVITPSIRPPGLEIVARALQKQTFTEFEWIICTPNPLFNSNLKPWAKDKYRWIQDDFKGGFWSLNRVYNKLIKEAKGELIVSLQDWIYLDSDALQFLWDNYITTNKKACIATSGDQYESLDKFGKPQIKIWQDPRRNFKNGSFYEIFPQDLEWNVAAIPKKALYDVGGFCEELDWTGYGMDGYQVNERLDLLGWKFYINHDVETFTLRHTRDDFGGQENWDKYNNLSNGQYEKVRQEFIRKGEWPRMFYLKNN